MPRVIGLDIGPNHVRLAVVSTGLKRVKVERLLEAEVRDPAGVGGAITEALAGLGQPIEPVAVAMDGERCFVRNLELPGAAEKQLRDVLVYELEAQLPVEFAELVYDFRRLPRPPGSTGVQVLAAAARTEAVRERIALVQSVLGREPERVTAGPLALANLATVCAELAGDRPCLVVDLGSTRTEVVVVQGGHARFSRTLSRGVQGLPASAPALARELRQSLVAWEGTGGPPVERVVLVGVGASVAGAEPYLSSELGVPAARVGPPRLELPSPEHQEVFPRFAKAIALALGLAGRGRDLDLRQGALAFQRGFGFLKERLPVLTGLGLAILVSFGFATIAEERALSRQREVLVASLTALSKEVLGQATDDPERALELLERARAADEPDPKPHMDAVDFLNELSRALPPNLVHDVDELDHQRGKVRLVGVVQTAGDAQAVASSLSAARCIVEPRLGKITQVVNAEKQKYSLELEIRCPEDAGTKKTPKKKSEEAGAP